MVQAPTNILGVGNEVDWTLSINGTDVGTFVVPSGNTAPIVLERSFAPIAGPSYAVEIRVTNEVPGGGGSHSLASTGSLGQHSPQLVDVKGFQCSLDHTTFVPCVSPKAYSALSLGPHSFEVSAVDVFDNADATPAAWQWTVVAAPSTEPPKGKGKARKCKRGFKKVKKHGKSVCVKKKHRKPKKRGH